MYPSVVKMLELKSGEVPDQEGYSCVFWGGVTAGTHTVKMQRFVGSAYASATVNYPNLVVIALPSG